jgi:hypothetical protein
VDWFDRGILQYMLWWAPFGGPPEEDVFPRFGMNASQLADRFAYIVATRNTRTDRLDPADIDLLARARCHPQSVRSQLVQRRDPRSSSSR